VLGLERKWKSMRGEPRKGRIAAALILAACAVFLSPGLASPQSQQPRSSNNSAPRSQGQANETQQQSAVGTPSSVLLSSASPVAAENLDLVAASTSQIRSVLVQNPGLVIELKRLLAERATQFGQVLTADDLTDEALYEKLDSDLHFRAAATQLLQRYGYLLPTINPNSELGEERQIFIQQRALALARLEQQRQTSPAMQATSGCLPQQNSNCAVSQPNNGLPNQPFPLGNTPSYAYPPSPQTAPQTPVPATRQQPMLASMPGETGVGADMNQLNSAAADAGANPLSALSSQSLGGETAGIPGTLGAMGLGNASPLGASQGFGGLFGPTQQLSELPYSSDQSDLTAGGAQPAVYNPAPYARGANGVNGYLPVNPYDWRNGLEYTPKPAELVARKDPFADIPSLYDMYMQAAQPTKLQRFGLAVFRDTTPSDQIIPMDLPVGPNYVVGPGDGLTIDLWGSVSQRLFEVVDRTGRVTLPEVGPVEVSGDTLGQVQQLVQKLLRTQFRTMSADVSVTRLKTVRVYVVGDVEHPGAYDVSSLSTPLNAEFAAGGPTANGSLRVVQHWRGKQLLQTIDVYDLLLHGVQGDILPLEDGDTIRVPTVGPEVTVEGMVRRPDIYELRNETNLAQVIQLAGGILPAATLKHIEVQRLVAHQKRDMLSLNISNSADPAAVEKQLAAFHVQDGDVVHVFPMAPYNQDAVYLEGHVLRPGKYAYRPGMRLADLIGSYQDLLPQPSDYAEIIRLMPPDYRPVVESFNLAKALKDPTKSPKLDPLDTVRVYSEYDFQDVPTVSVGGAVRQPGLYRTSGEVHLLDAIELAGGVTPSANMASVQVFHYLPDGQMKVLSVSLAKVLANNPNDNLLLGPHDSVLVHENLARTDPTTVYVEGEVAHPGRYPLAAGMRVSNLIQVAGGLTRSADRRSGELTRYVWKDQGQISGEQMAVNLPNALADRPGSDPLLRNGDVLTIRQVEGWNDLGASIEVKGEVKHPGRYGIQPGERLSAVLEQAGGFTRQAYPYGALLERTDVRHVEMKSYEDLVARVRQSQDDLMERISTATNQTQKLSEQAAYQQWQTTLQTLMDNPPLGRVVIQLSPNLRRWANTPQDIQVRAGDVLIIPKQPSSVMVQGQVYNPTAVAFRPGRSAKWYLSQAGGPTTMANKKGIFVIRADGSVVGSRGFSMFRGNPLDVTLYPGDTVVVPEKAVGGPSSWRGVFQSAQMLSSIVTSAVLVAQYY
jgi:protein involved in polysaccharide export with SLBB domain